MHIDQDETSIPEPFKVGDSYELDFEGYADGLFEQVTVSIPAEGWEDFKKAVVNA